MSEHDWDIDWIHVLPAEPLPEWEQSERQVRRTVPLGRPAVASTLTALGTAGTIVAAALPWSGPLSLLGIRSLATSKTSWLVWLVLSVAAAAFFGLFALIRPTPPVRRTGVLLAAVAVGLSGWAWVDLPPDRSLGPGPGLAVVALLVLTIGQAMAAVRRAPAGPWRWRPAATAGVVAALLLVGAGFGSADLAGSRDLDATEAAVPPNVAAGALPATLSRVDWARPARLFDATAAGVLIAGQSRRGSVVLTGVAMLDVNTGNERWHHYERGWSVREAAIVDGTALLVVDTTDGITALGFDPATGVERWRHRLADLVDCATPDVDRIGPAGGCSGQFITGAGVLYVGGGPRSRPATVTYLRASDGGSWRVPIDGLGCRPRGAGGDGNVNALYVLVQCTNHGRPAPHLRSETALAFDLSGRELWATPLPVVPGAFAGDWGPVFGRAGVALFEQEQTFAVLDGATGARLWATTSPLEPEEVVTDGRRLIWSNGALAIAVDARTGDQDWRREWQFPTIADVPMVAAGRLSFVQRVIGPTQYTCMAVASLLTVDPATGTDSRPAAHLPAGASRDCGPDVRDRGFVVGPHLVLADAAHVAVLS